MYSVGMLPAFLGLTSHTVILAVLAMSMALAQESGNGPTGSSQAEPCHEPLGYLGLLAYERADPAFFFDWCKRNFSRHVSLLHDYGLYEFTLLTRKDIDGWDSIPE